MMKYDEIINKYIMNLKEKKRKNKAKMVIFSSEMMIKN